MPPFDIVKQTDANSSFRVASIIGKFDLPSSKIVEKFTGNIDIPKAWNIGMIVGKSGTGKTTIAKELFPNAYISSYTYKSESVIDDMPEHSTVDEITKAFNSVGLSSPPSWLKPYSALSNGQKMRTDLARAILDNKSLIVFDEFTSVVDRQVAQITSHTIQKAIRKANRQFIAVSCHFDIVEWLQPDWIFNTDTMTFQSFEGQKKNRPAVEFEIFSTADKTIWKMFAKHHYLSHSHNNAATTYVGIVNNELASFISVMHFPHPKTKNMKKVHRLVVLPDYQGMGIGIRLLNEVGKHYLKNKFRFSIVTSAPALVNALKMSNEWSCTFFGRKPNHKGKAMKRKGNGSENRFTAAFEMKNNQERNGIR